MGLGVWRDISLLWLIVLTLISVLPFCVIFYFAVRGMRRLRQLAILYLPIAQDKARIVASTTEQVSLQVASPIISVQTKAAQVNGLTKAIFARRKNG
jgi:hypothetical protein